MVGFKEWKDFNKFMQKYAKCCCQNCVGWIDSAINESQFVCMRTVSPVRLELLCVCVEWQDKDGKTLDDFNRDFPLKFSRKTWDELVKIDEELTFEEIKEIIENEEH